VAREGLDAMARERVRREFLAAALSHELKQPLHALNINVELLSRRLGATAQDANIAAPIAALGRAVDRIGDCLDAYAERAMPAPVGSGMVDLGALAAQIAERAAAAAQRDDVRVVLDVAPVPQINGNGLQLAVALEALLDNAVRASPPGGIVALRVMHAGDEIHIVIADSGAGMGPELARRAFEIGMSTWGGEGIGLTVAKFIAYHHSGSVAIRTSPEGTVVTFALPIATE
jgi:signal transduction histidine kinase